MRLPYLAVMAVLWPSVVSAQAELDVREECLDCSLTLDRVAVLAGPEVVGSPMAIARTRANTFLVSFYSAGNEVSEFDATGRFRRVVARRGQGPGEVTLASHIERTPEDSIRVYDSGRLLVFTPELEFHRTEPIPVPSVRRAIGLPTGGFLVSAGTYMPGPGATPLHLVMDGVVTKSFGADPTDPVTPATPHLMIRALTTDGQGRIWSAPLTRHELTEWDTHGTFVRSWRAPDEHFRPWTELTPLSPDALPDSRLVGIQWIEGDLVLVLVSIPGPDWRTHLGQPSEGPGGRRVYRTPDIGRIFHTRLEVLDLSRGVLLMSQTEPMALTVPIDTEHVAGYREGPEGNPSIEIFRVRLHGLR